MIVLGIDVGLQVCGFCIAKIAASQIQLLIDEDIVPAAGNSLPEKLNYIYDSLKRSIDRYHPGVMVVEKLYSHYRHPATLGKLAQVRGVCALLAQHERLDFHEYSPTRVRKAFLGRGSVDSERVKRMAESMSGRALCSVHAADAFSLIVAFSHEYRKKNIRSSVYDFSHTRNPHT
ncbi:MAG: hypothetical protein GF333_02795 [Candidatus Omnitrophica bacterium]|nr:hypothetical protein [Candidatus Omnitrophota bacterium]